MRLFVLVFERKRDEMYYLEGHLVVFGWLKKKLGIISRRLIRRNGGKKPSLPILNPCELNVLIKLSTI